MILNRTNILIVLIEVSIVLRYIISLYDHDEMSERKVLICSFLLLSSALLQQFVLTSHHAGSP